MNNINHECPESLLSTEQAALIKTYKASRSDKISGWMLKDTAESIARPVAMIFYLSIKIGVFPQSWKLSSVVTIPSSSENAIPTNYVYWPISVLSKLLEEYIHALTMGSHKEWASPTLRNQWGFQAGKKTVAALLGTCHNWLEIPEKKRKEVEAVFFDFKKAFDTVPHKALLDKLQEIQLDGILTRWIRSYLNDRTKLLPTLYRD